jgi:plastocyanin
VVASLTLVTPALAAPGAALAAPAEGCSWQRHSKAVVKRMRRHGRLRRVRQVKHWWTCEAQPSVLQPQPALPVIPTAAVPPDEEPEVSHLGVKAVEYSYTLSRPEVSPGEVIVELNNQGEDPHNLVLEHEDTADPELEIPSTPSVSQASSHFTLSPGTYRLYCSLYKHEAKGMEATLVVGD